MSSFILRYINCLLISSIGLNAPAIVPASHNDHQSLENCDASSRSRSNQNHLDKNAMQNNTWRTIKSLSSFVWPRGKLSLQLLALICMLIIVLGRLINFYSPIYNKKIVDSIASGVYRWDLVVIYVALKFLQRGATGGIGFLNNIRSRVWMQIQQYTSRKTEIKLFSHLHGLSLRWHLRRKTGEILHILDRGTDSINKLLDTVLFSIVPTIFDIIVTVIFFAQAFSKWLGFIVFTTVILYIAVTVGVTTWRSKFLRQKNEADKARKARCTDSLLNFETVKYYGAESIEVDSFKKAILEYQSEEWKSMNTLNLLNFLRNLIVTFGLLAGSLLCLHMVVYGKGLTTGDFVLFATSIIQLYVPLNSFGTYYGEIQNNFVDMENMFDLLLVPQEITDAPNATSLIVNRGHVEFSNVSFSYTPERPALKNISFLVPPGKTMALVGPSGAGKSTIIRLLSRFYDVDEGSIFIDGQDIKTVKQESLRKSIGVVPQDTVLFNNTIKYNIQYGRLDASEDDIVAAAKDADIHERILTFPDGYETKVGERGLCLSGGEKQRVAIARTILKAPKIVLLDEATSALDTQTERNIQEALRRVHANCTTIIIAHRLSTIIHADEILVLKKGEIAERGKHEDLIARTDGIYYDMWMTQQRNEHEIVDEIKSSTNRTSRYIARSIWLISSTLMLFSVLLRVGYRLPSPQHLLT